MQRSEIRNRIIFIDVEAASTDITSTIPISIAAIDYDGFTLMNEHICPRQHISNYRTRDHGLTEDDLIGKRDSETVLQDVRRMLRGRIIVGYDLHLEYTTLNIKIKEIAGARDLQSSIALAEVMNDDEQVGWSLQHVVTRLGIGRQTQQHTALQDVQLIRKVYLYLEDKWEDTPQETIHAIAGRTLKEQTYPKPRLIQCDEIRKENIKHELHRPINYQYP